MGFPRCYIRRMDDHPPLGPQDEAFIDEALKSGRYPSRTEILRQGIARVREREAQWVRFEAEIQKGIDSLERGEGIPLAEAFAEVRAVLRRKRSGRKDAA